jgi:hypothetical protein
MRTWAMMVLLVLTGCSHNVPVPVPPTPPSLNKQKFSETFAWHDDGNPQYSVCSPAVMPPCKVNYVFHDETLNVDLATLPMIEVGASWMQAAPEYTMVLSRAKHQHVVSLYINIQDETAAIVASPKLFTTIP